MTRNAIGGLRLMSLLVSACAEPEAILGVSYDERWGDSTVMDVYLPPDGGSGRPAVMLIHGGGWVLGTRDHYTDTAKRLARSGFVAATIEYRLVPDGAYPAAVQDCVCALSFLRARADEWGLDAERVAVMGYSAGGHLASLLGVAADFPRHVPDCASGPTGRPDAVVSGAGPQSFEGKDHEVLRDFLGGTDEEVPENYRDAAPLSHVAPGAPPYLFVHAGGDWFVDVEQSEEMRDALRAKGDDASLLVVEGGGHLLNPGVDAGQLYLEISDDTSMAWMAIVDFLDRSLEVR